jgi:hypothetical protein
MDYNHILFHLDPCGCGCLRVSACGCQSSLFALFPLTAGGGEGSQWSQTGYLHYSVQAVVGQADAS